ncbi:MAG: succinate dehydrogenase, hydrophobic membrane anchor protein [Mariprofundales bacterium]|nr:succinate dehydrogenase, hydrophobic membrane anchor protein [Mariprofundales bacterium]
MSRYRLGTAHNGLHDWYLQRVSAVILLLLLPLAFLLLLCVYSGGVDYAELWSLHHHTLVRLLHSLLAFALSVHIYVGLKVVVEDYLSAVCLRTVLVGAMAVLIATLSLLWLSIIWNWSM